MAGKKEEGWGEGIFARPPLWVVGGCASPKETHMSEISIGILFKIGSNFIQKTPPIFNFRVFKGSCLALASLGLGKSHDFIGIFEIKKQFSFKNLEVRFAEGEYKLKNLLTNLFCSAKGGTQSGNLSREAGLTAQK